MVGTKYGDSPAFIPFPDIDAARALSLGLRPRFLDGNSDAALKSGQRGIEDRNLGHVGTSL